MSVRTLLAALSLIFAGALIGSSCDWAACQQNPSPRSAPVPTASRGTVELRPVVADQPSHRPTDSCESIPRRRVSSSAISSIGYCSDEMILEVEFIQGAVYRYFMVPERVYDEFMDAPSHGRYINTVIKPAGYRYLRVR